MSLKPLARDGNGQLVQNGGSDLGTYSFAGIPTTGTAITLPIDCKEVILVPPASTSFKIRGTATAGTPADITLTSSITLTLAKDAGETLFTLKSVADTITVGIIVVR